MSGTESDVYTAAFTVITTVSLLPESIYGVWRPSTLLGGLSLASFLLVLVASHPSAPAGGGGEAGTHQCPHPCLVPPTAAENSTVDAGGRAGLWAKDGSVAMQT